MDSLEEIKQEENGVEVLLGRHHANPSKSSTFFNPIMKINREFVLAALVSYVEENQSIRPIKCLDGFGASGMAGLQWKHHCEDSVVVTINDMSQDAIKSIKKNATHNQIEVRSENISALVNRDGMTSHEADHVLDPSLRSVEVTEKDANIMMHQRQFHFIHLDPFGSTTQFLDAAFRNIYNKGLLILTSTDLGSLYGKCPLVTLRNYGSNIAKTDYLKELAARVVIGEATRSAAKCNKGFEVLYTVAVEHFVQVALLIKRGAKNADTCISKINQLTHCQMCNDWAVIPNLNVLEDNLYQYLPCSCDKANPGKTAIKLGPAWCGNIFSAGFLSEMSKSEKKLSLSDKFQQLLTLLIEESQCNLMCAPALKKEKMEQSTDPEFKDGKRMTTSEETHVVKKLKGSQIDSNSCPLFFYNLHKRKFKGLDIPRPSKLVSFMKKQGFLASRTHFDNQGIRTNASVSELRDLVAKYNE